MTSKAASDRALDFIKLCYIQVVYSHPSTAGTSRQVMESEAEEFALIMWRHMNNGEASLSVSENALNQVKKQVRPLLSTQPVKEKDPRLEHLRKRKKRSKKKQ